MKKRNIDTNFQLKSRPVSASIGKFYSDKMKKMRKPSLSRGSNKISNSYNIIDKKTTTSTYSSATQSLNQFGNNYNNNYYKNNKNLADILNEIINSKINGNNNTNINVINEKNSIKSLKRTLSPSPSLTNLLQDMKVRFSKKYVNTLSYKLYNNLPNENKYNMNSFQKMIDILKDYEREKYEKKRIEKLEKKEQINNNIDKLTVFLKSYHIDKKKNDYENFKLEKRINTLLYVKQKYSGSAKELENIAEEIEEIGKKIKDLNNETSEYKKLYLDEEKNISQYKKEIGLTNKSIYDLKKEIDSIVPGINYLIKHSNEIKNKISTQEHLNSIFFLNMLNMIEKVNSH